MKVRDKETGKGEVPCQMRVKSKKKCCSIYHREIDKLWAVLMQCQASLSTTIALDIQVDQYPLQRQRGKILLTLT